MNPSVVVLLLLLGWHENGAQPQMPVAFDAGPFHVLAESGVETEARAAAEWVSKTALPVLIDLNGHPLPQPLYDVLVYTRNDSDQPAGLFQAHVGRDPWRGRIFVCAEALQGRPPKNVAGILMHEAVHALLMDMIEDTGRATRHPYFGQGDPHALVHAIIVEAYMRLGRSVDARFVAKHARTEDDGALFRELQEFRNSHGWAGIRAVMDHLREPSSPSVQTETDFLRVIRGVRYELNQAGGGKLASRVIDQVNQIDRHDDTTGPQAQTDEAELSKSGGGIIRLIGRLHPHLVHFPIALLWALLLVELSGVWRTTPALCGLARFLAWGSAISAIPAVASVFVLAHEWNLPADMLGIARWHQWTGVASLVLAWGAIWFQNDKGRGWRRAVYVGVLLAAVASVTASAYFGRELASEIREMRNVGMSLNVGGKGNSGVMVWEVERGR